MARRMTGHERKKIARRRTRITKLVGFIMRSNVKDEVLSRWESLSWEDKCFIHAWIPDVGKLLEDVLGMRDLCCFLQSGTSPQ